MAYDNNNAQVFRHDYRAGIARWYNPWLHAGFVQLYGWLAIAGLLSTLEEVVVWQWLLLPLVLVFFSWGEYQVHKRLGHQKTRLGRLFYKRHTGDHHSFFIDSMMVYEQARDWRVILFPAWLIVLYSVPLLLIWLALRPVDSNLAALFCAGMLLGYLLYEIIHACEHLADDHMLAQWPWIRQMRHYHALHHRRELMHSHNFGIVHPLMDWFYGTLYWEPLAQTKRSQD